MKPGISMSLAMAVAFVLVGRLVKCPLVAAASLTGIVHAEEKAGGPNGPNRPLLDQTFEKRDGGWVALGGNAQARLTPEAARIKTGKAALALDYTIVPKQFAAAVLPVADGLLAGMKSLRFWLRTDSATPVAVILSEKKPGGGNYAAVVWSPKDTWQQIELAPDDFALNEGPNDPVDTNGKLDLDQIEGVGIIDLGQLFAALNENPSFPIAVERRSGRHTLYIDDFQALPEAPHRPPSSATQAVVPRAVVVDDFHRPYLNWLTLGGAELSLNTSGNPLARRALQVSYEQAEGRYVLITHPLAPADLRNTDRLVLEIASARDAQIVLSLEKRKPGSGQGPRYNATIEVPGNQKPVHEAISFADFKLDENGPADPEGKLDVSKLKTLSLVDVTGAFTHEKQKNTIWIADIHADAMPAGQKGAPEGQRSHQMSMPMNHAESMPAVQHPHETSTETPQRLDESTAQSLNHSMAQSLNDPMAQSLNQIMSSHHMHMGPHVKLTELRPSTPEDLKRADDIVKTLREALQKYTDYRVAIKDGYLPYLPNLPQREYHFTNYGYGYMEAFRFDPAHPTSLLYKKTPDGYELAGAMYTAPYTVSEEALNARVPLDVARWHLHVNICLPSDGMAPKADWARFGPAGSIATEKECAEAGGKFMPHLFGWMVHVYPFEHTADKIWPR